MPSFETLDSDDADVPLCTLDETESSSSCDDDGLERQAADGRKLYDQHRINMWCIVAYAMPSMFSQFYFTMFTVFLVPYLLKDLGLTAFQVSLVLLAGPFSGLTASPVFGILSDRSRRRFIFLVAGAAVMAVCQLVLGWSREITGSNNMVAARWLSTAAIFTGTMSVRAYIIGFRLLIVDNVPPRQQPVMNLVSSLLGSLGSVGMLAAGFANPSFQLVSFLCSSGVIFSIVPVWLVRPAECYKPVVEQQGGSFTALLRDIWRARTSLPPKTRRTCGVQILCQYAYFPVSHYASKYLIDSYVATRGNSAEAAPAGLMAQASVFVLLIAQTCGFVLQMPITRSWDPSLSLGGSVRQRMNKDITALRQMWALALLTLGVSSLGAIFLRTSFMAASICIASIVCISPLSGLVPLTIISYEAAVVQKERGPSITSSGTYISYYEMAITVGQGLSAVGNAILNFGIEKSGARIGSSTAILFCPSVVGAIVAALIC
ncbi:sucrose transporter [Colletotrichum navitas]|uniref:Sucrose transporter n=1 Tax=Colletotrichum navitas TaxID=681940 RepID=A0AAD8UYD9_9PEZI|nr:sucrose transporter [Colletotrichum navitas]KAK1570031.1 sucrose transporter [Colletotrichum navitas]